MQKLVLNQYRAGSGYKDVVGEIYHFPDRYLNSFKSLPVAFIYYEPRSGGDQVYFGAGIISSVSDDTLDSGHSYGDVSEYVPFENSLSFYEGPDGESWEQAKTMRNSVRKIEDELFGAILNKAGVDYSRFDAEFKADESYYEHRLEQRLRDLRQMNIENPVVLRKVRRVIEAYERPSAITNTVKEQRGDKCQLCGCRGFLKRNGTRYCEVHHLFHLSDNPPAECLGPDFLVVVCATCHRRLHYANVGIPERVLGGWQLLIDDEPIFFSIPESKIV